MSIEPRTTISKYFKSKIGENYYFFLERYVCLHFESKSIHENPNFFMFLFPSVSSCLHKIENLLQV